MILVLSSLFVLRTDIVCTVCIVNELALALALTASSYARHTVTALVVYCALKAGLNEFPLFLTKRIKGYSYA